MKALIEYITSTINTRVPAIKTVRPWNNQFLHSNETNNSTEGSRGRFGYRNEKAFAYPACFIEIITEATQNFPLGIIDYNLIIRFRFGVESYKFVRLETFDFCDDFIAAMHLLAPTEASGLTFTTFQTPNTEFDEDHNNVDAPYIDYRTRYRSSVAYSRRNDILAGPIVTDVDGVIVQTLDGITADNIEITADNIEITADSL